MTIKKGCSKLKLMGKKEIIVFILTGLIYSKLYSIDKITVYRIIPKEIPNIKIENVKHPKVGIEDKMLTFQVTVKSFSSRKERIQVQIEIEPQDIEKRDIISSKFKEILPQQKILFILNWKARRGEYNFTTKIVNPDNQLIDMKEDLKLKVSGGAILSKEEEPEVSQFPIPAPPSEISLREKKQGSSYKLPQLSTLLNSRLFSSSFLQSSYLRGNPGYDPFYGLRAYTGGGALPETSPSSVSGNFPYSYNPLYGLREYTGSQPTPFEEEIILSSPQEEIIFTGGNYERFFAATPRMGTYREFFNEEKQEFNPPPAPPQSSPQSSQEGGQDYGYGDYPMGEVPEPSSFLGFLLPFLFSLLYKSSLKRRTE